MAAKRARQMADRMRETWPQIAPTLPLADDARAAITDHLKSMPLFAERRVR